MDGNTKMNETIVFDCTAKKKMFDKNDFKIYAVEVDQRKFPNIAVDPVYNTAKIIGTNIYELDILKNYTITAVPKNNSKYGVSYEVVSITTEEPKTEADIRAFLQTILTSNQTNQIMEHYPNIIQLIKEERTNEIDFSKLKGITPKRFEKIKAKIINNFQMIDVCATFYNLIPISVMQKLFYNFGSVGKIKEALKAHPYTTLYNLDGIGFIKADAILLQLEEQTNKILENGEIPRFQFEYSLRNSTDRCLACMEYFLEQNENDGNTKMTIENLKGKVIAYAHEASIYFNNLLKEEVFHVDTIEETIGLQKTYNLEEYVAQKILSANTKPICWNFDLEEYAILGEFHLTEHQQNAYKYLCQYNVVILNGPAGSGKTSSVKALTNMLVDHNISFAMAAPSAKAAKVLTKYAGYEATTIHRMLRYENKGFYFNESNPLHCQVVIIDESSMVDLKLMVNLLKAIDFSRTKLLLVGDSYQLPSVGAGNILHDLIHSNVCPIATLDEIFRYSEGGLIKVATDTRNCKQYLPSFINPKQAVVPFGNSYFFCPQSKENCVNYLTRLYSKLSETNDLEDIMVITSQNIGDYGTFALNSKIQNIINPQKEGENVITYQIDKATTVEYRNNDIVMQIVNDYHSVICDEFGVPIVDDDGDPYETLIANGESGRITLVNSNGLVVKFDNYYIWKSKSNLGGIMLGYAITCHKSQGSGCKNVIVLTPSAHTFMLNSALLYVGFTRAKEKCYHIGSLPTVNAAIKKRPNFIRKTFLQNIIKKMRGN